ncbi:MAG: hypothetical protein H6Q45_694, partial [Deltaproteobacteria bacterium]|nr:hypothetical protein [Deltaproteobacteria bacterium]
KWGAWLMVSSTDPDLLSTAAMVPISSIKPVNIVPTRGSTGNAGLTASYIPLRRG